MSARRKVSGAPVAATTHPGRKSPKDIGPHASGLWKQERNKAHGLGQPYYDSSGMQHQGPSPSHPGPTVQHWGTFGRPTGFGTEHHYEPGLPQLRMGCSTDQPRFSATLAPWVAQELPNAMHKPGCAPPASISDMRGQFLLRNYKPQNENTVYTGTSCQSRHTCSPRRPQARRQSPYSSMSTSHSRRSWSSCSSRSRSCSPNGRVRKPRSRGCSPSGRVRKSRSRDRSPSGRVRKSRSRGRSPSGRVRKSRSRGRSPSERVRPSRSRSCSPSGRVRKSRSRGRSPSKRVRPSRSGSHSSSGRVRKSRSRGHSPSGWARLAHSRGRSPSGRVRQSRSRSCSHRRRERKPSSRSGSPYSRAGRSSCRSCSPHSRVRHSGSMNNSPHGSGRQFGSISHSPHSKNGQSSARSILHCGRARQSVSRRYLPHCGARLSSSRSHSPGGSARPIRMQSHCSSSSAQMRARYSRITSPVSSGSKHAPSRKMSGPSLKVSRSTAELNLNYFCVKVMNLPLEAPGKFILGKIKNRFKSFGNVISVTLHHAEDLRFVVVVFKSQAEQTRALGANGDCLFGHPLSVTVYKGSQSQYLTLSLKGKKTHASVPHVNKKSLSGSHHVLNTSPSHLCVEKGESPRQSSEESNDSEPQPSRMLFISNLDSNLTNRDLFDKFGRFGEIVDVYINSLPGAARQFAFLQFARVSSTARAIKAMNGAFLGKCQVALSFGAIQPTRCVFMEGLSSSLTNEYLIQRFSEHGTVEKVLYSRERGAALILYVDEVSARKAVKVTRSLKITGDTIIMDFANDSFQLHFCQSVLEAERRAQGFYCV